MARIWQEGFEDGLPYAGYLEGNPNSQQFKDSTMTLFPSELAISNGRNVYSVKSLKTYSNTNFRYTLTTSKSEVYLRVYIKLESSNSTAMQEALALVDTLGNNLLSLYQTAVRTSYAIYARYGGSYASRATLTLEESVWYKIDFYYKVNSSSGAYEVKVNDISIIAESSLNTGTNNVSVVKLGGTAGGSINSNYYDDVALNDTTGSVNNSWCGNGTIVSLKPKGAGNKSQWDTCEGYAKAEDGTTTTNIEITGHGLSTNDVIYNKSREAYRIVTVVDANNLTVSSVSGQTQNDIILLYKNVATISATSGTTTSLVTIAGHTMQSGDVIVNTSRSNAIRKVIYVNGNNVYNNYVTTLNGTLGSTVTSQASGDSIKTFAFTPYTMTNHYEAVANQTDPSPKLSYIKSTTSGDIDTFDMEELVADKALPSSSTIVAVSHNIYAQEAGAGSQIKPVFRISSSDYEGSAQTLSSGTLQYQTIYETSPATSSAWSRSEIDGLEAGVKLV